ncbi:35679_t:CDS:2, partial [Racocetra persica]
LGRNIKRKETPNINNIIKNRSLCFEAKAILPTDSGQNWGSILYGVDRDKFSFDNSNKTSHFFSWMAIFHSGLLEKDVVDFIFAYTLLEYENLYHVEMLKAKHECGVFEHDEYIVNKFKEIISTDEFENVGLFVIHLTDVNEAGHYYEFNSEKYYEQLEKIDKQISEILSDLDEKG